VPRDEFVPIEGRQASDGRRCLNCFDHRITLDRRGLDLYRAA
jgi:hypothetical protein